MEDLDSIIPRLKASDIKGLRARDGSGAYPGPVFHRLYDMKLMDSSFRRTDLGNRVLERVGRK
jgi:hypothetical protein